MVFIMSKAEYCNSIIIYYMYCIMEQCSISMLEKVSFRRLLSFNIIDRPSIVHNIPELAVSLKLEYI